MKTAQATITGTIAPGSTISVELRERLHQLLANPQKMVRLITPENQDGGQQPWKAQRAVQSGECYCIIPRSEIIAADFDGEDGHRRADKYLSLLKDVNIPAISLNSGGDRRAHVWAWCPEPDVRTRMTIPLNGGDMKGDNRKQGIRPPGTPHRTGTQMTVRDFSDLDRFIRECETYIPPPSGHPEGTKRAPVAKVDNIHTRSAQEAHPPMVNDAELLRLAKTANRDDGDDRSRSATRQAWICKAVHRGYDVETIISTILYHKNGIGSQFYFRKDGRTLTRPRPDREKVIRHDYQKAVDTQTKYRPPSNRNVQRILDRIEAKIDAYKWPAHNQAWRATMYAIVEEMRRNQSLQVCLSCRQIALRVGINWRTMANHLKGLANLGWIQRTDNHNLDRGTEYTLIPPEECFQECTPPEHSPRRGPGGVSGDVYFWKHPNDIPQDLFSGRGSCRALAMTLRKMSGQFTITQLADMTKRSYNSTYKAVEWFVQKGLIKRVGKFFEAHLNLETMLEALLTMPAKQGRNKQRRQEYNRNRDGYRKVINTGVEAVKKAIPEKFLTVPPITDARSADIAGRRIEVPKKAPQPVMQC